MRLILILALIAFALSVPNVGAQHLPDELRLPSSAQEDGEDETEEPQGVLDFSADQSFFDQSFTSKNNVIYTPDFDTVSLEQSLLYELRRDKLGNTRHYLNVSGSLALPQWGSARITPGLDWSPVSQYSTDRSIHNALATLDAGPTAAVDAAGVPVFVRGGISARRVDSLAGFMREGEYRGSVGAYGGFRIGSEDEPLPWVPIYFYADGLGRRIENSGMASLASSALGAARVGENDSLFVYGGLSLFNGREGYLEESADSRAARFTETPWRIERTAAFTAGYKAATRYVFDPSAYYGLEENALEFPGDARRRDERTIRHTLSGAVSTDSTAGVYYSGTIGFVWRDHDKLFGKEIPIAATADNIDSLEVNLWDYRAFEPRTAHKLIVKLPRRLRLKYDLALSRFLTEYPNYYVDGRDTVTNKDDSDRRTINHRIALEYKNDSTLRAEAFGEITDYGLVFLRSSKSSSNRTDNGQKIGLLLDWSPFNELLFSEAVWAEAKRGEFHFPEFHQKAGQRPRYSRAVNSSLSCDWQITGLIGINGKWNIKSSDYGFWYGREYMEEALEADSGAKTDYYAITSKSVYTTIDLAARFNIAQTVLEAGNAFTGARDRNYSGGNYIITNENGLSTKPYFNATLRLSDNVEIVTHISHTFVIGNSALGYWDFKLQAEGWF